MGKQNLHLSTLSVSDETAASQIEALADRGIMRLSHVQKRNVREIWQITRRISGFGGVFVPLVQAMIEHNYKFKDCDPNEDNLLADDIEELDIPPNVKTSLRSNDATSLELFRRVKARDIATLSGMGGQRGKAFARLKLALQEADVQFREE